MHIHTVESSTPRYYYQCLKCRDTFICPDWQSQLDEKKAGKVAVCPYCKSNQLDAFASVLPLVIQ